MRLLRRANFLIHLLLLEVLDDLQNLKLEQVVEDAVGCRDDDVAVFQVEAVVVGARRRVLAHDIARYLLVHLLHCFHLIDPTLLLKINQVSLCWKIGKLIWSIEGMLLLFRFQHHIRLAIFESHNQKA